jgi:hypothetical protein
VKYQQCCCAMLDVESAMFECNYQQRQLRTNSQPISNCQSAQAWQVLICAHTDCSTETTSTSQWHKVFRIQRRHQCQADGKVVHNVGHQTPGLQVAIERERETQSANILVFQMPNLNNSMTEMAALAKTCRQVCRYFGVLIELLTEAPSKR